MRAEETIDCYNGCNGGHAPNVWKPLADEKSRFAVEEFCDPYQSGATGKKEVCGGHCANGNKFSGVKGSVAMIDMSTPDGRKQAQLEIMKNGSVYMSFQMYDSFHHYSSGVYSQTANEKRTAGAEFTGHAMTLIGWGEEGGVPYWLIQNSWGDHRGEKGLVKFRRGYDDFEMESQGIWFVKPEIPTVCANAECKNGATILKDYSLHTPTASLL